MMQISMKSTMTTNGQEGKYMDTNIAEDHASRVSCFPLDENGFAPTNMGVYGTVQI
jgi:hypothetical protein